MKTTIGRFAPTPSGYAHIGNLFCFFLAWLSARSQGGKIVLRIEDLDTQRTSLELARGTMEDLERLGLTWDAGPGTDGEEYYQSRRSEIYSHYFEKLREQGVIYPCFCTRTDVKLASAPHTSDGRTVYPGTCRHLTAAEIQERSRTRTPAWRVRVPDETIRFTDGLQGEYAQNLETECGDFPLRRADGVYCYQLAVVVDDALMGVNEVVRASDLLSSTPQQIYLYRLLGFPVPKFIHIPTVLDADGNRLAKRDKSVSLRDLGDKYTPEEIIGRLCYLAGLQEDLTPRRAESAVSLFSWDKVPRGDIRIPRNLF